MKPFSSSAPSAQTSASSALKSRLLNALLTLGLLALPIWTPAATPVTACWPAGNGIGYQFENATLFSGMGVVQAAIVDTTIKCTNVQWFATSANVPASPRIFSVSVWSDLLTTNVVRFYISTNQTTLTNSAPSLTTNGFAVASTNGFVTGDFVLIRGVTNDWYQFGVISNFYGQGLNLYQTLTNDAGAGDIVYKMTLAGSLTPTPPFNTSVGGAGAYTNGQCSAVTFANPQGLFAGAVGKPILITSIACGGGASNTVTVCGEYYRPASR